MTNRILAFAFGFLVAVVFPDPLLGLAEGLGMMRENKESARPKSLAP